MRSPPAFDQRQAVRDSPAALVQQAKVVQRIAERNPYSGILGLEPGSAREDFHRALRTPGGQQGDAEVVLRIRVLGPQPAGVPVAVDCLVHAPGFGQQVAEVVVDARLPRIGIQRTAKQRLGLVRPALSAADEREQLQRVGLVGDRREHALQQPAGLVQPAGAGQLHCVMDQLLHDLADAFAQSRSAVPPNPASTAP